jgi:hypothetical protein
MSDEHACLAEALLAFQAEAPALQRDKLNPAFRSKYLTLDKLVTEITPTLNKHGLVFVSYPTTIEGGEPALTYELIHAASKDSIQGTVRLLPVKMDPQAQGSAITYARRYVMMAVLGLVADEDDDGNAATGRGSRKPRAKRADRDPDAITTATKREIKAAMGGLDEEKVHLALAVVGVAPGTLASKLTEAQGKQLVDLLKGEQDGGE